MVPNLPREDLLIGQIDPARLISSTEVPENFSTVGLVLGEPTAQAGPTDSKDSRPRIGEAQPEPASSSVLMEFSIGEGSVSRVQEILGIEFLAGSSDRILDAWLTVGTHAGTRT